MIEVDLTILILAFLWVASGGFLIGYHFGYHYGSKSTKGDL